ncbi:type 2 periplasmic-binding domain-containing protein [Paenibacillus cymbidii]|uniref:hypothetical protein n=1 Tax=Paenibacillus cymbidii TaxID=1639034 RepID=UPI00108136AF|nr:hypothetical protein [Paenibacillus cymbidii]
MRKVKGLSKALVLTICASLLVMTGCTKSSDDGEPTSTASAPSTTAKPKENVKISVLWCEEGGATNINTYKDNPVLKEIEKRTNTTLEILGWNAEKLSMSIAGGDLPDLICTNDANIKKLYDAKMIVDMAPLIEKTGSKSLLYAPNRIKYAKDFLGTEGIYYLTPAAFEADVDTILPMKMDVGPSVRWDYYKELGYPSIKSFDDYLAMVEQMVQKHPTTPDGKKVYGFGLFNDWSGGLWSYGLLTSVSSGVNNYAETIDVSKDDQSKIISDFYGPQNPYYQASQFYNKAYRKGLMHPDAFTMKYADFEAAAVKGEIISNPAVYGFEKANQELLKAANPTSFMMIPFDFGYSYSPPKPYNQIPGYQGGRGLDGKNWTISTKSKIPDRVVEFLNFVFSPEGSRIIYSGVEGVNWEYDANKKPVMKKETVDTIIKGGEDLNKTGIFGSIAALSHLRGVSNTVKASDGGYANLQSDKSTYIQMMNTVQKDYAKYYGVDYPSLAFTKKVDEKKMKFNADYKVVSLPAMPDDIKRIDVKLQDILVKGLPKTIIEPKTDEEWVKAFDKLRNDLNAAGAQTVNKWAETEYMKAYAKLMGK